MNALTGTNQDVRYEDVSEAVAHAFYSQDGVSSRDVDTVERYWEATVQSVYEPAGFLKKLKLKYLNLVC